MRDVATGGRTVLFVSHNLSAVQALCGAGVLLEQGRVVASGDAESVVAAYAGAQGPTRTSAPRAIRADAVRSLLEVTPREGVFVPRQPLEFTVRVTRSKDRCPCHVSLHVYNALRENVLTVTTEHLADRMLPWDAETISVSIASPMLVPGSYQVDAFLYGGGIIDQWENATSFAVSEGVVGCGYGSLAAKGCRYVLSDFEVLCVDVS
jgi:lipopolysaccharide transport system ATP-binding protein